MKTKPQFATILTLIILIFATIGGYAIGRLMPEPSPAFVKPTQPVFTIFNFRGGATPVPFSSEEPAAVTIDARIRSFDISPDGKTIAFATSKGVIVEGLDSKEIHVLAGDENSFAVKWSFDGAKLAAGNLIMKTPEAGLSHLVIWDTNTWKTIFESASDSEVSVPFGALAWSPNGRRLAAYVPEHGLAVLDVATGEIISAQTDFMPPPTDIDWAPDGSRLIATGDLGFGFLRWRLGTNESVRLYDPRVGSGAAQLAWSPDGNRIASGHDSMVCLWTVETNQCDGLIQAHRSVVSSLAWSPDGSKLATGGGVIRIWDSQTGRLIIAFGLNEISIYTELAWLQPELLVSLETGGASDAPDIVRFWDLKSGKILMEFRGQSGTYGQ
ncbi:MAG: PD40 domain-containing protein [Anaerolineales bacterium]|nr:PD40 domain-containing protein [Anaerolineales bacterium]MCL4260848.1 PD40 domain-containing protein [Anaerolineales bacterium]